MNNFRQDDINHNTLKLLFRNYENLPYHLEGKPENLFAFLTMDKYTLYKTHKLLYKIKKFIIRKSLISFDNISFNQSSKNYEYFHNDCIYTFDLLSNYFDNKSIIKELTSSKRYGQCANRSMDLCENIKNSKILIGYVTVGNQKSLHAVVEITELDETYILDWTRNIKITKLQYIKLMEFHELSSLDSDKLNFDVNNISWNIKIGTIPYLIFRDELINDMKRNPDFFFNNISK